MHKIGRNLDQRRQYKIAMLHIRMGNSQLRKIDYIPVKINDININGPYAPFFLPYPAELLLNLLYECKQCKRFQIGMEAYGLVQVRRQSFYTPGFGFVNAGGPGYRSCTLLQCFTTAMQLLFPVAQV